MNLYLKTNLRLKDTAEVRNLIDVIRLEFIGGNITLGESGGICNLGIDLSVAIRPHQKALFIDLMRTLDSWLVDTVYVSGYIGDEPIAGYMGPERLKKEKSRAHLEEIKNQIKELLPEHRVALQAFITPS